MYVKGAILWTLAAILFSICPPTRGNLSGYPNTAAATTQAVLFSGRNPHNILHAFIDGDNLSIVRHAAQMGYDHTGDLDWATVQAYGLGAIYNTNLKSHWVYYYNDGTTRQKLDIAGHARVFAPITSADLQMWRDMCAVKNALYAWDDVANLHNRYHFAYHT